MFEGLAEGLRILLTWEGMLILVAGSLLGMLVAVLPGLGGPNTMALLLPVTFGMDTHLAIALLVTIMAAGGFGGSIPAILINVPGDAPNAATTLDGYPMSQKGLAGEALGASATASALGAALGVVALVLLIPIVPHVIRSLQSAELFALALGGLALIAVVSRGNPLKGIAAGLMGMTLGFFGLSEALGGHRFTFGTSVLFAGFPLIPTLIGIFAIPEIYRLLKDNRAISREGVVVSGSVLNGILAVLRRPRLLIQSSLIGTGIGIMPGVGASTAPWVSYFVARSTSRHPEAFGTGIVDGVIAPEASNDSKDGGGLVTLLALGIPGGLVTALLLSAFMIHGVQPGQRLFASNMPLVWVMILALLFTNFTTSALGLAAANYIVRLTILPATVLAPIVFVFALVGGYSEVRRAWGLAITLIFGLLGIIMQRGGFPRPPLLVGFILLPLVERNFHRALAAHRNSYEFLLRPITLTVIGVVVIALAGPPVFRWVRSLRGLRGRHTSDSAPEASRPLASAPGQARDAHGDDADTNGSLATLCFSGLGLLGGLFLIAMALELRDDARLFPSLVLPVLVAVSGILFASSLRRFLACIRSSDRIVSPERGFPDWWVGGWLLLLPLMMMVLGMIAGIVIFIIVVRMFYDRGPITMPRLLHALAPAVGTAAVVYLLFVQFLNIRLINGLLF